jgi:hypothetical protein
MPRRRIVFGGARRQPQLALRPEPVGPHVCEACGAPARWGYSVRLLQGQEGRWFCFAHRPEE